MKRFLIGASGLALAALGSAAQAQDRYLGDVFMVGYTFCPRGTTEAQGQLLSIFSNQALFALYGTTYGGDGRTTFGLPDMRARSPIGQGSGPGLGTFQQGARGGSEFKTLSIAEMPRHNHDARVRASTLGPNTNNPAGASFPTFPAGTNQYVNGYDNVTMADDEVQVSRVGDSQGFSIRDPYIAMRFCVVLSGVFPSRN